MTRRLPEGPLDPTKIPRIPILVSQDVFLVSMGGVSLPLLEDQIGRTRSVRRVQLDGTNRSHNPKVGGSNPAPATQKSVYRILAGCCYVGQSRDQPDKAVRPSGVLCERGIRPRLGRLTTRIGRVSRAPDTKRLLTSPDFYTRLERGFIATQSLAV
jgi:hypothetical protein